MLFNSFEFVGYLAVVLLITYVLNYRKDIKARNVFLLAASWIFYGSFNYWFLILREFLSYILTSCKSFGRPILIVLN